MIRSPFGSEQRRGFNSPQPELPPAEKAPTAEDPATKAKTDAAAASAKRAALAARGAGRTRLTVPSLGPRQSTLLGGGMGPM